MISCFALCTGSRCCSCSCSAFSIECWGVFDLNLTLELRYWTHAMTTFDKSGKTRSSLWMPQEPRRNLTFITKLAIKGFSPPSLCSSRHIRFEPDCSDCCWHVSDKRKWSARWKSSLLKIDIFGAWLCELMWSRAVRCPKFARDHGHSISSLTVLSKSLPLREVM